MIIKGLKVVEPCTPTNGLTMGYRKGKSYLQLLLVTLATLAGQTLDVYASSASPTVNKGMRNPVPLHIMKWTDKLKIQSWLDAARAEITKNGSVAYAQDCDSTFGQGYLDRWKAAKKDVCLPGGRSTYTCYEHPPVNHGSNTGSMFCTASNLILDSADFLGDVLNKPDAKYPTPKKGSARVACSLPEPLPWRRDEVSDNHADRWLYDALQGTSAEEVDKVCGDTRRTVAYPVYFVTRMDPTNAFHHFEEVVNFFTALWLYPNKEVLQQGITIVALDGNKPGFYLELWRRMAYPYRLRFLRARPYPPGTCFKHVLIASMPTRSFYTHFWPGRTTSCRSTVFTAVMNWARALIVDTRPEAYTWPDGQHRQNDDTVVGRITWVSRQHFETANRDRFTGWQVQRMIDRDDSVVTALAAAVQEWNGASCLRDRSNPNCRKLPVYFEFGTMELGDHRWYPEQLFMLARTNVLVAVHGAGVFNEVWMRPSTSSVIEVMHNSGGNYHYHNIAAFMGLPYHEMYSATDVDALATKLKQVMDDTAQRMAEEHMRKAAGEAANAAAGV